MLFHNELAMSEERSEHDQGQSGGQNAMFVFSLAQGELALLRILTKLPLQVSFLQSEIILLAFPESLFHLNTNE